MKGHLDADVLAEYRAWLITGRRRRAIAAHLSGCTECAALDARLAQVSALLAAAPAPSMPEALARRLDDTLAAEIQLPIPAERRSVPARKRRFPSLASRSWVAVLRVRVMAPVAAAAAVLAGGGYVLSNLGGVGTSSGPAAASAGSAHGAKSEFGTAAGMASGAAEAPVGPARSNMAETGSGVFVVTSGLNYTAATLKTQVAAQLRVRSSLRATPATFAESRCVLKITHGAVPVLTEKAHYQGTPATVIVVSRGGSDQVWVAGPACTATDSNILAQVILSPGISAP